MSEQVTRREKQPLIQIFVFALVIAIIVMAALMLSEDKLQDENPFDLRIDAYDKIDPELIKYEMIHEISVSCTRLYGVTVDAADFIYAATESRIIKFNKYGSEMMSIEVPDAIRALAIHENGDIYAASARNVFRFSPLGTLEKNLITLSDSSLITSIAVHAEDLFIADAGNRIVRHYSTSGEFMNNLGGADAAQKRVGFIIPSPFFDLALGNDHSLWVVNPGMHRLENFDHAGVLIQSWGIHSPKIEGFCGCCNPSHFAITPQGRFVTSEKGLVRVKVYDATGTMESVVAGPDQFTRQATGLDVVVDSEDRIIIACPATKTLKIFVLGQEGTA